MSEWSIEHAWKSDLFTRADAQQIPPTHVRSISSRYNEVLRDAPVSDDVRGGDREAPIHRNAINGLPPFCETLRDTSGRQASVNRRFSIFSCLIFDSRVEAGIPSVAAAPCGPATFPRLLASAFSIISFS